MTSKFPLVVILAEMAAFMEDKGIVLHLDWVPRNQNEEADALSNERFEGFDLSKRVEVNVENLPFYVLPKLIEIADDLYGRVWEARKCVDQKAVHTAPRKARPLRERDPW